MAAEVKLVVRRLEGFKDEIDKSGGFSVEFNWGSQNDHDKELGSGKKRRIGKIMKCTKEVKLDEDGVVLWNEEFRSGFRVYDEEASEDLEIEFKVFSTGNTAKSKKRLKIGTTSIYLSHWASADKGKEIHLNLPLEQTRSFCETDLLLCITLTFSKLQIQRRSPNAAHKSTISVVSPSQLSAYCGDALSETKLVEKKIIVYTRRAKQNWHGKGDNGNKVPTRNNGSKALVHCDQLNSNDTRLSNNGAANASLSEVLKDIIPYTTKRKRSERGTKTKRARDLKVVCLDDSEDDVDSCCLELILSDTLELTGNNILGSSKDNFLISQWEQIDVASRDALLKLHTRVLFASIDQRSEQAKGSSACSALVVVIANWLHVNEGCLPDKSQFDALIEEGSHKWRELKKNEGLMESYTDAHFDIKTVLHLCPICVDSEKTTVGFFRPEGLPEEVLNFLTGTTSFDDLWKEISEARSKLSGRESLVYIVGWNDHFFLLKADSEAYYIIDTLGERLFEGCDRGYILKFDKDSKIYKNHPQDIEEESDEDEFETETESLFNGAECCKYYLSNFLAALPLNEAIENNKKGMLPLHRLYGKLQIEFSYTKPEVESCSK